MTKRRGTTYNCG